MTQEEVAFKAGISFTTVNNLENSGTPLNPTLATILAIADALKVDPADLMNFK